MESTRSMVRRGYDACVCWECWGLEVRWGARSEWNGGNGGKEDGSLASVASLLALAHTHTHPGALDTIWTRKHKSNSTKTSSMLPGLDQLQRYRCYLIDTPISTPSQATTTALLSTLQH